MTVNKDPPERHSGRNKADFYFVLSESIVSDSLITSKKIRH